MYRPNVMAGEYACVEGGGGDRAFRSTVNAPDPDAHARLYYVVVFSSIRILSASTRKTVLRRLSKNDVGKRRANGAS
jgi:hypothetical protein